MATFDETAHALRDAAQPVLKTAELVCADRRIVYTIRESRRSRAFGIVISPQTGVAVTVPASGYRRSSLERFLRQHQGWIVRHVERLARVAALVPRCWPFGETLPFQGRRCPVVVLGDCDGACGVSLTEEGALEVRMARPGIEAARRLLRQWYRTQALRYSEQRVQAFGPALGVTWRRVRVGDQRHRWGSCSSLGSLNFNYRLMMAPPEVFDYVIWHELAHCRELNHSRRFWALVARYCAGYRRCVDWLHTHGPYLSL